MSGIQLVFLCLLLACSTVASYMTDDVRIVRAAVEWLSLVMEITEVGYDERVSVYDGRLPISSFIQLIILMDGYV